MHSWATRKADVFWACVFNTGGSRQRRRVWAAALVLPFICFLGLCASSQLGEGRGPLRQVSQQAFLDLGAAVARHPCACPGAPRLSWQSPLHKGDSPPLPGSPPGPHPEVTLELSILPLLSWKDPGPQLSSPSRLEGNFICMPQI